jgi:hypothetical protein
MRRRFWPNMVPMSLSGVLGRDTATAGDDPCEQERLYERGPEGDGEADGPCASLEEPASRLTTGNDRDHET